jgi:hypothetical protein
VGLSKLVKFFLALLVVAIAAMLYPPIRLSALVFAGRSPVCPLSKAVKSESNLQDQIRT